jgi:hypothetical protein
MASTERTLIPSRGLARSSAAALAALALSGTLAVAGLGRLPAAEAQEAPPAPSAGAAGGGTAVVGPVRAEIFVVLASEVEGAIDPALADMPALRRPPFNAFHTMQVLDRSERQLSTAAPVEVALPNGRQLRIELERATSDGRYRVRVSINTPGRSDYLNTLQVVASPGDPFFIAGQNHQVGSLAGTLVIGVRIGQRPATRKA